MSITAIYNEYDLWGKVRVSREADSWLIVIDDKLYRIRTGFGIRGMIERALNSYLTCEHCEGSGVVTPPLYTASGGIPDCDHETCKECGGSGKRKIKED